jgi:hypothetical protein
MTDFKAKLHDVRWKYPLMSQLIFQKISFLQMPLAQYFPEYSGGTDVNKGVKYVLWRFMQLNHGRLNVYPQ